MSRDPSLFAAMDAAAMRLREQPTSTSPATWGEAASQSNSRCFVEADLQIAFRELQRYYWPELDDIEWLNLYRVWRDGYFARMKREERQRFIAHVQRASRHVPPATPFKCVCGVEGDPSDPEYERIHREHVFLAQFDK